MSGLGGTGVEIKKEIVALMPAVHLFAMRFERSATDADDLTQDTMLKALAHLDQFRPGTNLKSWLFTIARNTYCTKQKIRQRFTLCADMEVATSGQAVQSTQEWALRTGEVGKAISALDPDKRQVLLMATSGDSYEDIAGVCGCELGTIKSRVAGTCRTARRAQGRRRVKSAPNKIVRTRVFTDGPSLPSYATSCQVDVFE